MNPDLLTPEEVADLLRVPVERLAYWRKQKKGPPFVKVGRAVRYPRAGVFASLVVTHPTKPTNVGIVS